MIHRDEEEQKLQQNTLAKEIRNGREKSVVWISETKLDDFYYSGFSDYCRHLYFYIHNISDDMSSGFL